MTQKQPLTGHFLLTHPTFLKREIVIQNVRNLVNCILDIHHEEWNVSYVNS